jgi:DNA-binding NarL/FixJ family response regulator
VLLADDQALVRAGFALILSAEPDRDGVVAVARLADDLAGRGGPPGCRADGTYACPVSTASRRHAASRAHCRGRRC